MLNNVLSSRFQLPEYQFEPKGVCFMKSQEEIKQDICEVGRRLYNKGYVVSNDGNISVRVGDNEIWVTPASVSKGFMTPDMMVKVDLDGKVLEGTWRPTSELPMHLRVYRERPDVSAVVHAHPPYATSYAVAGIPLDKYILPEAVIYIGHVPIARYGTPATEEIPDAVAEVVQDCDAMLLESHGALTYGHELFYAYNKMESLEFYAQVSFISRQLGGAREFSNDKFDKLMDYRKRFKSPGRHPGIKYKTI